MTERFLLGQITFNRYWKDTNYVFQIFCKDIDGLYLLLVYTLSTPSDWPFIYQFKILTAFLLHGNYAQLKLLPNPAPMSLILFDMAL